MSSNINSTKLPDEMLLHVFSFLDDPTDLAHCMRVDKQWGGVAQEEALWKRATSGIHIPKGKTVRQHIADQRIVGSNPALVRRLKEFAQNVPPDQAAHFRCSFPLQPECSINLRFGFRKKGSHVYNPVKENVAVLKKFADSKAIEKVVPDEVFSLVSDGLSGYVRGLMGHDEKAGSVFLRGEIELPKSNHAKTLQLKEEIEAVLIPKMEEVSSELSQKMVMRDLKWIASGIAVVAAVSAAATSAIRK